MYRIVCVLCLAALLAAPLAFALDDVKVQGNWDGKFTKKTSADVPLSAQVIAQGNGAYRAIVSIGLKDGKTASVTVSGATENDKVALTGTSEVPDMGEWEVSATIAGEKMKGKVSGKKAPGAFEMARVEKKSPTLGAKPPADAVVLFDGKNTEAWKLSDPAKGVMWEILPDGAMEVRKSNLLTKQEFGDQKLHLEFRTPFLPSARGQARGNSGVYIQGRYEIQVLDSFGLPIRDNECGGIYKKATPKVNACLPPMEWQTYDVTFHAPKFDDSGKKIKNAVISVEQNGIVIHDNAELDGTTPGGVSGDEAKASPLFLQDHGHKVQYRNIWIQPLP